MLSVLGGVLKNGSGNTLLWSNDGLNWTVSPDSNSLFTTACGKIAFNRAMWIAGAGHGENANVVAYSSDGICWFSGTGISPVINAYVSSITWDGSKWLLVYNNTIYSSSDGKEWVFSQFNNLLKGETIHSLPSSLEYIVLLYISNHLLPSQVILVT